jgi:hypothetical protein
MAKNAVLLSGPPGIGKTSSALIICCELGFEPVEVRPPGLPARCTRVCRLQAGRRLQEGMVLPARPTAHPHGRIGRCVWRHHQPTVGWVPVRR